MNANDLEFVSDRYYTDEDFFNAQVEAIDVYLNNTHFYMGVAVHDGQLGIAILETGQPNPPVIQFVPTEENDLARMTRVYSEVYGCIAGRVALDDLTPRGKAIVACKKAAAEGDRLTNKTGMEAEGLAQVTGLKLTGETLGEWPGNWAALEAQLAKITYTILNLSINGPVDPDKLDPKFIMDEMNRLGHSVVAVKVKPAPEA